MPLDRGAASSGFEGRQAHTQAVGGAHLGEGAREAVAAASERGCSPPTAHARPRGAAGAWMRSKTFPWTRRRLRAGLELAAGPAEKPCLNKQAKQIAGTAPAGGGGDEGTK